MNTLSEVFVAREDELARLDGFLQQARAGESAVCFVAGEAGAGKTALITEFARRAQERDPELVVAIGECNAQTGIGDPYLPFREVLQLLAGSLEGKLTQGRVTAENASRLREFRGASAEAILTNGPDLVDIFLPGGALAGWNLEQPGRRLSAIWFADLVGYSRLSARDEPAALRLTALLQETARDQVERCGGRVVKFLGDGVLAEFTSTAAAAHSAHALLREFAARSAGAGQPAHLRAGVHLGDVVGAQDGDLYGESVNLAARLQEVAEPDQVLVSGDVWRQLRQRPEVRFTSLGERELKGVTTPVPLFAVEVEEGAELEPAVRKARPERLPAGEGPGVEQSHIFEQYTSVLRSLAARRPLVLILDDLQWADAGSIGLLFHLARRLGSSRVLLVGTYRPDDVALGRGGERHPLESVLNELKRYRGDVWVDLAQAQETGGRGLVDALVDTEPNRLDESFRDALHDHTQGHPLFALELLRHLQERGDLRRDEEGRWEAPPGFAWNELPPRVEGVIAERIGRLEEDLRETLRVASVEGESFTAEVVARVRDADARGMVRCLSGELEKQHRLVGAEGIRRLGPQRVSLYRFRHNLFQKYLYGMLDEIERSYLHEDVGHVLEALYGERTDEVAVQLARHFEEAGDLAKAVRYLLEAGERSSEVYANTEAIRHFERALDLLDNAPPATAESAVAVRLREGLGDVLELTGRHEEARNRYGEALDGVGEEDRLTRGRLYRKAAKTWEAQVDDEALELFGSAESALGPEPADGDPAWWQEWIQIQLDRVFALYFRGQVGPLIELQERATPVVERYATPRQKAVFLQASVQLDLRRETYRLSAATIAKSAAYMSAYDRLDSAHDFNIARFQYGFCLLWHGDLAGAEPHLREVLDFAQRTGHLRYQALAGTYLAFLHRLRGEVQEAGAQAQQALEVSAAGSMDLYVAAAKANLAWVALRRGEVAEAEELASAALDTWLQNPAPFPWRAYALLPLAALRLQDDQLEAALAYVRQVFTPGQQPPPPELAAMLQEAIAAWDAGQPETGRERLESALELAREARYL